MSIFHVGYVMSSLNEELRSYSESLGIDLFGVADLSHSEDYITHQGGTHVGDFPRAISLGIHLIDDVLDQLDSHNDVVKIASYREVYDAVN
jgi:hypothetical protein